MVINGKILVPTDFSERSFEVLKRACVMASKFDAELHLLHVITASTNFEADLVSAIQLDEIKNAQFASASKRIAEQAASVDSTVITHVEEAAADPALAICDYAREHAIDLIITGRHSQQTALEHMLIGSTAERVVRYAPCSIFVVMPHGILADI